MKNIKLDAVQQNAKRKVLKDLKNSNKALVHMATGTGKTEVAIKVKEALDLDKVLWLTHQNELLEQTADRIKLRIGEDVGVYNGSSKDRNERTIVSSIQTLSRPQNLKKFKKNEFDLIIVDEAHHAPAETWSRILNKFSKTPLLGLTATPYRPDGLSVTEIFGEPSFKLDFETAQQKKFLAKDRSYVILTNSVINGFLNKNKDYSEKQLDKLYTSKDRNNIIVASYLKYGRKQVVSLGMLPKAICFCINVQHAQRMKALFLSQKIKAEFLCGDAKIQTVKQRETIFSTFKTTNDIEILCVVNLFNEGVDIPEANIALMARPTRSNILYQQQVGRLARRLKREKETFVVLDFVDNTTREYTGYILGNLKKKGIKHSKTVVDYVQEADPVIIKSRIKNIMASVKAFESKVSLEQFKRDPDKYLAYMVKTGKIPKDLYVTK